jgi:hypothetical protein
VHTPKARGRRLKSLRAALGPAVYERQAFRAPLVGDNAPKGRRRHHVFEDDSVRAWHQGDDVLILSFKTKMHVIGRASSPAWKWR